MIFVTLGTHEQGFTRALHLVSVLAESDKLVVQVGATSFEPFPSVDFRGYLDFAQMERFIEEASAVVCHAGVGSILTALAAGHCPVVLPRLKKYGEHVDDHQLTLAARLHLDGLVIAYSEGDDLTELVSLASRRRGRPATGNSPAASTVADEVYRACRRPERHPRRRRLRNKLFAPLN